MTRDEQVGQLNDSLKSASPVAVLKAAFEHFESPSCAFSGGEDVVLIDMLSQIRISPKVFFLDTGRLSPQTYKFVEEVRLKYSIKIDFIHPEASALSDLVDRKGLFSFYKDGHSECCGIRKVEPLRRYIENNRIEAWVTGQRRDSSPTRSKLPVVEMDDNFSRPNSPVVKFNPLAGWSLQDVWDYIRDNQVPYNPLHDQGYLSIGCEPCNRAVRPGEHERAGRWWWEEATQRECGLHLKAKDEG